MAQVSPWDGEASRRALAERTALRALRAVYRLADAAYAPFSCPGTAECCQLKATKREPWLWPVEWQLLVSARDGTVPPPRPDGGCPFLAADGKRCSVYAERPFGCRTFFCHRIRGPAREPLEAVAALSKRLESVAQSLHPDCPSPRPLMEWARAAWEKP
jgi:uncharacterized protein